MTNAQPEPSMEEILASIRRIISEDEESDSAAPARAPAAVQPDKPAPSASRPAFLSEAPRPDPKAPKSTAAKPAEDDRAGAHLETEDVEMIKKNVATAMTEDETYIADTTAEAASQAFQTLTQSVRVSKGEGRTLEDIVTDLLRPMVKDWLDANLPAIVQEKVEEEVQRLARRRG